MKKIALSFFLVVSLYSFAQNEFEKENIFSFAPGGFVNKIRLKFEQAYTKSASFGSHINIYYLLYKGVMIEPFYRYYFSATAPVGIYAQLKASAGFFMSKIDYTYEDNFFSDTKEVRHIFPAYGGGMAAGYQWQTTKSKLIDVYVGYRIIPFLAPTYKNIDGFTYNTSYGILWYITGPGSILNCHVGLGYYF